jgi:single-stranded-DNA-specific exonuclease
MAHALLRALALDGAALDPDAGLDLVALGTVADVAPLRGENRALVRRGLPALARAARPGLRALIEVSGVSRLTLSPRDVSFGLAPRLNAPGRLGDASTALALLRARRPRDARPLARELDTLNAQRQDLTRTATEEAITCVEAAGGPAPIVVVWHPAWHPGVVGLVASRLVERYRRPAVVVGQMDGRWRGSARSVEGFDIGAALAGCADLLARQGGHPMAAGLEAAGEDALAALRDRLEAHAAEALGRDEPPAIVLIDLHLSADEVDWSLADALAALHPCGAGWPDAVVAVHGALVLDAGKDGGALRLRVGGRSGMAVSAPARAEVLPPGGVREGDALDLAVTPTVRDRRGYRCLELDVLDARHADPSRAPAPPPVLMV